jgi:hypothetical protein
MSGSLELNRFKKPGSAKPRNAHRLVLQASSAVYLQGFAAFSIYIDVFVFGMPFFIRSLEMVRSPTVSKVSIYIVARTRSREARFGASWGFS